MHHVELQIVWILYRRRERTLSSDAAKSVSMQNAGRCRRPVPANRMDATMGYHMHQMTAAVRWWCREAEARYRCESKARQEHGIGAARLLPHLRSLLRNHRTQDRRSRMTRSRSSQRGPRRGGRSHVAGATQPAGGAGGLPLPQWRVELVNVTATVTDRSGHFVAGLTQADFTVYEDDRPVDVAHFSAERVPVSLGIVLDTSGSMAGDKIVNARAAIERFLRPAPQSGR